MMFSEAVSDMRLADRQRLGLKLTTKWQ